MTNADKFKHLFGIYATELWAMPAKDFLEWLNADAQDMPTGKWIPCSERLPENDDKVLCCTVTTKGVRNIVIGYYMERWCCGMNSNVIAWQPLPKPYKEAET